MRRHIIAGLVIALLAIAESSLLPTALGSLPRPNLVLIVSSTWAALRGEEGFLWATGGGLLLDFLSGAPFGIHTAGLVIGNVVALALDRVPIPVQVLRIAMWVAVTTVVYYGVTLVVLAFAGRSFDVPTGFASVVAPNLVINSVLAIPTYLYLSRVQSRLREQERFLPER